MKRIILIVVLLLFAAVAVYDAIWAREIRDRQLIKLERFHGKDSRIFRFGSKLMGASYVWSFRVGGAVTALVLLAAIIYVLIHA